MVVSFMINIVVNISKMASFYCDCSKSLKLCPVCELARTFYGYQYIIYRYSLNFQIGQPCSDAIIQKLYIQLEAIMDKNPFFVERVVKTKFFYAIENIFSGKRNSYSIDHCLKKFEDAVLKLRGHPNFDAEFKKLLSPDGFF